MYLIDSEGQRNLKIGVFHPSFHNFGGGEFVALVVANTLAKSGHQVELFVSSNVQQNVIRRMFGEEIDSSVNIRVKPSFVHSGGTFDIFPTTFRSLALKLKCDILIDTYSNCVFPWSNICYIHFPFLNSRDYNTSFPYLKSGHIRYIFGLPHFIYAKKLQRYSDKLIIANSKYTANIFKNFVNTNVEVIYPPVSSALFSQPANEVARFTKEDLVVTVSRFAPAKGLEKIPYIAKQTKRQVKFVIIGLLHDRQVYKSMRQSITRLGLDDRIEVITNSPKRELESTLGRAKIYLHTMVGEHFGISIVEAMAMGCLPIVHKSGGMVEYVPSTYFYENPREAAEKIDAAISEWTPRQAIEIIRIAERFSESNFSKHFAKSFSTYIKQRNASKHY
jgi:glycosyltransferase involved in cell wall biosynthesis